MARTAARGAHLGALCGAAGGFAVALGDFGASWLWLPLMSDQLSFLIRLFLSLVPLGAIFGAVLGALHEAVGYWAKRRFVDSRPWLSGGWPAAGAIGLLLSPGCFSVAQLLFTGAKARALGPAPILIGGAFVVMVVGCVVVARVLIGLLRAKHGRTRRLLIGGVLWAACAGLGKVDQIVLPNLYEYLHGALSLLAWGTGSVGLALLLKKTRWAEQAIAFRSRQKVAFYLALLVPFAINIATLNREPNVRVAMFDPRASTSHSVMLGLRPLFTSSAGVSEQSIADARDAREARRRAMNSGDRPVWDDAHFLLVTIDALRADHLGTYGYERDTSPHIDALAADSIVFERAYAQAPHSSYSLCSLMTSEYVHQTVDLALPLPTPTLATELSNPVAGRLPYHTAAFFTLGIFHTEGERLAQYHDDAFGFLRHDHTDDLAPSKTDRALTEARQIVELGEVPTFFWVHYFDAHEPYRDTHFGTSDMDRYDSEIRLVDGEFNRLLTGFREILSRDLIVVITADHGEEFRDHGGVYHGSTLFEEQVRVPLILHAPDLAPRRVAPPVELVDVAPTVLRMLGREPPATMRGDDLLGLALGEDVDPGPAFSAVSYKRMVVRWPHKLIADLRFGLFQLYDLSTDPMERQNLAGQNPELRESLRGEVYAWIDGLSAGVNQDADPREIALSQGRLGDRRSLEQLELMVQDPSAPPEMRVEGCQILGRLGARRSRDALATAMQSDDALVAAEAAVGLGRLFDPRAQAKLRDLVHTEDPVLRSRAAVSLGRLRDPLAVPALIDALRMAPDRYDREEAIRWLGRLRDPAAVEPLLTLIPEFRVRQLSVIALGNIGDARAMPVLVDMLTWDTHTNVKNSVIRALGQLGRLDAIEPMLEVIRNNSEMTNSGEALVRLNAVIEGHVGGNDIGPDLRGASGLQECQAGDLFHDWNYRRRTTCQTGQAVVTVPMRPMPETGRTGGLLLFGLKRLDAPGVQAIEIQLGEETHTIHVDGGWNDLRIPFRDASAATQLRMRLPEGVRLEMDHALLIAEPIAEQERGL